MVWSSLPSARFSSTVTVLANGRAIARLITTTMTTAIASATTMNPMIRLRAEW